MDDFYGRWDRDDPTAVYRNRRDDLYEDPAGYAPAAPAAPAVPPDPPRFTMHPAKMRARLRTWRLISGGIAGVTGLLAALLGLTFGWNVVTLAVTGVTLVALLVLVRAQVHMVRLTGAFDFTTYDRTRAPRGGHSR